MKKIFSIIIFFLCSLFCAITIKTVNAASPLNTLNEQKYSEEILYKLQNSIVNEEIENIYSLLESLNSNNTLFFNYKIKDIENLLQIYKEAILKQAKKFAEEKKYKKAVELLQSKSNLFKDKSTLNSLTTYYSKYFIQDGLFYCEEEPVVLCFSKLIGYPEIAFSETNSQKEADHLTANEFQNLLKQLYDENYILINFEDMINLDQDSITRKELYLPANKKPLILVFNDNNYNNASGFIEKYIIDPYGEIACYNSKETEKNIITYNKDYIPILEAFISSNKDFSFNNARAMICFNENDKILGYNISKQNPNQAQEILSLKKLVNTLKEKGYKFSYNGSINNLDTDDYEIKKEMFQETLKQIFGEIKTYYCQNSNINLIKTELFKEFNFKIVLSTIKTNTAIFKQNFVISPINQVTFNNLNSQNFPVENLDFSEIYDHINRKEH